MNNYRSSFFTYTQAADYAARLKLQGATSVSITETADGYDVTWRQV